MLPPAPSVPGHYRFGDIDLAVSGVATIGTSIRTTHPDPVLIPPQNGKALGIPASGVGGANIDDGNLNWVFMPGLNITPTIGLSHDVSGWSYDGVFSEGRVLLNLKLRAEYDKKYFTEVAWNPALRNGTYDSLSDRQIVPIAAGIKF